MSWAQNSGFRRYYREDSQDHHGEATVGTKAEQVALVATLRADGASWVRVVAECRTRWGLNARQILRVARCWTQQQVADEWCQRWPDDIKTDQNISTWERWPEGGHSPSLVVLDRLAQIYGCSVADLVADFDDHGAVGHDDGVDRRSLLAALGATVATAAVPGLRSHCVAPELPDYFETQLRGHYSADMLLGPRYVLDTVTAQYRAICNAIDASTGGLHAKLLNIAASYAALAGWLHQDAGDLATSTAWRSETLEMAHRSGDVQLVSYALTNKAMLRVEVGDGIGAVDLASAALAGGSRLAPKVRIVGLMQAAQGYALVGDRVRVDRTLDDAANLIDSVDDSWPWGNAFRRTPSYVDAQRATCYGRLGLAAESAALWTSVIHQQPSNYRRDRGVYLARHARALLGAGEPHGAASKATQAIACYRETGSARMRLELAKLRDTAGRWTKTSAGRDLIDALENLN